MPGSQGWTGSLQSRRRNGWPRGLCVHCDSGQAGAPILIPGGEPGKVSSFPACRRSGGKRQAGSHQEPRQSVSDSWDDGESFCVFGVHVGDGGRGLTCLEGQVSDSGSYSVDSEEVLGEEVT